MKSDAAIGLYRSRRLHRQSFFAEVENHSAGNAIEAGEGGRMHAVTQCVPSVWSIVTCQVRGFPP
jgi:hypothetical protein